MHFDDFQQDLSSLDVISKDSEKIAIKLKGVPLQYANALRRVCLNGVPVFAIDTVDIIDPESWIMWYIYDNDMGERGMQVKIDDYEVKSEC